MKTNNNNILSHTIRQREEISMTAFLIQSTTGYDRKQKKKNNAETVKNTLTVSF